MITFFELFLFENLRLLGEMAPYLTLGFVLAGLLHAFVPPRMIARHLGKESVGSAVKAAVLGVPMPLCSCGVVPTGIGLRKRGAGRAAVVSFLISTPQTGVDSIAVTYGFFGGLFAVFRPIAAFLSGILGGIATLLLKRRPDDEEHWMRYHVLAEDALSRDGIPVSFPARVMQGMTFAFRELLGDIALWLVIGLSVAALISVVVPDDFFAGKLVQGWPQMLVMMIFGLPLYVCSTASIPIAAVLMSKGISAGAAFVFLMTGPATNAATLLIIGRVMGKRVLGVYLGSIAVLALGFGFGLDAIVGATGIAVSPLHHEHSFLPYWVTWGCAGLLTFFITLHFWETLERKLTRKSAMTSEDRNLELNVEGMTCSHCVRTVTTALTHVPGVVRADVDLATGVARIEGDSLDRSALARAVESVGYKVKEQA